MDWYNVGQFKSTAVYISSVCLVDAVKAAVCDFQLEEGKEMRTLSIKNSINEESEVKTATDQHVRVNGSVEEEETNFSA